MSSSESCLPADTQKNTQEVEQELLITPAVLKKLIPVPIEISNKIAKSCETIANILYHRDQRLLLVVGPCSIHDPIAALEYAQKLQQLSYQVKDKLFLVMRTYFAKPRTSTGWQGYLHDPYLDNSNKINTGLFNARELLLKINALGIPTATEFLDMITPHYILDLISWGAIGARTVESQIHRNFVSGLNIPVGFKNATDGQIDSAIAALVASKQKTISFSISENGLACVTKTKGNKNTHLILRGGCNGPNYQAENIKQVLDKLNFFHLNPAIMIDCSHGNSGKDYQNQKKVFFDVIGQLQTPQGKYIKGMMLESFLFPGNQSSKNIDPKQLKYGVSITDSCIGWDETKDLILRLSKSTTG